MANMTHIHIGIKPDCIIRFNPLELFGTQIRKKTEFVLTRCFENGLYYI
jgi:hypothetical protein